MATLEDIRRQFPQAAELSDSEIITRMSAAGGLDPTYVAGRLGVQINPDGFTSGLKRGLAGMVGGVGEVVGDVTGRRNNALTNFANDVEFRNPSEINSLQDAVDKPGLALRSAVGNAASFLIPGGGLKLAANGLRAAKAANTARALDNPLTQAAVAGLPSLGGIGEAQRESGEGENLALKYGAGLGIGAVENLGGLQRVLGFGGQQARRTAAQEVAGFGSTPWKTALKTTGRMMGQEGLEEIAQNPIEQMAGYRDPTTAQALEETALGGVMGTLGGVIGAGHGVSQGVKHARIQRGIATDMLNPEADYGRRRELGEYNQAFVARDTGQPAAQQWFDEFNQGAIANRDGAGMRAYDGMRRDAFAQYNAGIQQAAMQQDLLAPRDTTLRDAIDAQFGPNRRVINAVDRPSPAEYQRWWEGVPDPTNPAAYQQFWQHVAPVTDAQANMFGVTPDMFGAAPYVPVDVAGAQEAPSGPAPQNKRQMGLDFDAPVAPEVVYGNQHVSSPMYPGNSREADVKGLTSRPPAGLGRGAFTQLPIADEINTARTPVEYATNQEIPLPTDVGSAVALLRMVQASGTPVLADTPLHRAVLKARELVGDLNVGAAPGPKPSAPAPGPKSPKRPAEKSKPAAAQPAPKVASTKLAKDFEADVAAAVKAGVPGAAELQTEWNVRRKVVSDVQELRAKLKDIQQGPDVKVKTPEQSLAEKAKPAAAEPPSAEKSRQALTDKQRAVFDRLMNAVKNDEIDTILDAEGTFKYAEIGKALGLARGSAKSFIDQAAKRIAASQGMSIETMRAALRARAAAQRTVEAPAESKLGASPAEQETAFDEAALFGSEGGAEASAGIIDSVGGSQSDIADGGVDPEKVAPATDPRDVKRAEREAEALRAKEEAAAQEAAKIEARRQAEAESQRVGEVERSADAPSDEELFAGEKDWDGNPIKLVDVEDAAALWDEKADGLPLEGARRVQFVKAYIAWTDGEHSDRRFTEILLGLADEIEAAGQTDGGGLHRDRGEVQGETPGPSGSGESDLRGVTAEPGVDEIVGADEVAEPEADKAVVAALAAKRRQHGERTTTALSNMLRTNGVKTSPANFLFAYELFESEGSFDPKSQTVQLTEAGVTRLKAFAGADTNVELDDVDFGDTTEPKTTSTRRLEPIDGRRTYVRAMVGLRNNLPKSPTLDADLRKNLVAGNVKGALDAIANGGSSVAARQLAKKVSALMTGDVRVEVVEPGKYYPGGVPNILAYAYGVAEIDRDNKRITIYLRSDVGVNEETVLHEALHAALQSRYDFLEYHQAAGRVADPAIREFLDTWKAFRAEAGGDAPIGVREAARSPDEFITYALTNPETQAWMQSRRYRGRTLWERFKNFVAAALGLRKAPTWLDAAMKVSGDVLAAAGEDAADFSASEALTQRKTVSSQAMDFADRLGPTARLAAADTSHTVTKMADSMLFLHDLVDKYGKALPSAKKWYEAVQGSIQRKRQLEQDAEAIAVRAGKIDASRPGGLNEFISRSTYEQKWGYDAEFEGAAGKKTVKADPEMAKAFAKLTVEEQQIARDVFAHGEKMVVAKFKLLKDLGLTNDGFLTMGKLDGPYAPLKRFGDFVGVAKSQALVDAEKEQARQVSVGQPTTQIDKRIKELKADPDHYLVSYFDTMGQAKRFAETTQGYAMTDAFEKSQRIGEGRALPENVLQKVISAVNAEQLPGDVKSAMREMLERVYVEALDEHNARTSGLKRQNRAGYDADMIRSFLSHARAEANFLANIEYGRQMNDQFFAMQNEAKNPETGKRDGQAAFNAFGRHYAENLTYRETPWQDRAMALTSAWQLATSVGYHVTNATQGIMVTVPKLAADFDDYAGAWRHLMDGYRMLGKTGVRDLDLSKVSDAGLRTALQRASDMGVLDVGMDEDLTQFEATRTGYAGVDKASTAARKALHQLRQVSRWVETANRVSSAVAGYRMAREKGRSVEEAQDYAVKILQSTQGDFSRVGAPLLLKKLPKPMTQYRKYQFMMGALYTNAFQQAFRSEDPDTRALGRRMLKFKLAHTAFAAGGLGLPLMNLAGLVFAAMGDDDEPRDLERWLRDAVGDEDLADLLLHGVPAMAGIDMHAKLGDDKIFSITPYTEWDLSSRDGFAKTVVGFMGPAASQGATFADGFGKMQKGDYYKGLEQFMPRGIKDGMAAFRMANEGFTLSNGDVMVGPDDMSGFALAMSGLGMPSSEIQRIKWLRGQQYEAKQFFNDRTKAIQREYAAAFKADDTEALAELQDEWMALQDGKDRVRPYFNDSPDELKRQALSTLLRYPRAALERERKLQAAVPD